MALERVSQQDLGDIAGLLQRKSAAFQHLLARDRLAELDEETANALLRSVFSSRRRSKVILNTLGLDGFKSAASGLLWGTAPPNRRLQEFHETIVDIGRGVPTTTGHDLGSELLHFSDPDRYWLWTRWIWDPKTGTGALPLVVMEEIDLDGGEIAETYRRIGLATAFISEVGEAAGYRTEGYGVFGTDVFLACVYAVYMYTTLRMRMTQEFNKVVPELGDLVCRLLGVHRMELTVEVLT